MVTWHGRIFKDLTGFSFNLQTFFYNHKTLFDLLFLGIYSLEQIVLFILVLFDNTNSGIYAGIFAIIFITTISLERITMESRYHNLNENLTAQKIKKSYLIKEYNELIKDNEQLRNILHEKIKDE